MMFGFFFFNDTATTEIYTLPLHDALPISCWLSRRSLTNAIRPGIGTGAGAAALSRHPPRVPHTIAIEHVVGNRDRKSTRLNSSHGYISYAVFCLKKKKVR